MKCMDFHHLDISNLPSFLLELYIFMESPILHRPIIYCSFYVTEALNVIPACSEPPSELPCFTPKFSASAQNTFTNLSNLVPFLILGCFHSSDLLVSMQESVPDDPTFNLAKCRYITLAYIGPVVPRLN